MTSFSKQILTFLKRVQADPDKEVGIVSKSISCAVPGEVVFFRYSLGQGKGSRAMRMVLVIEPIVKDAATGNLLLTGFKMPEDGEYTPESLDSLYKNRELPKDNYRTYILNRIYGSLYRIRKKPKTKEEELVEKKINGRTSSNTST